jgi:putative nucleotidyltransferase with HDIG domain
MYVRKLVVSWMDHPFLRNSFLLTDRRDIRTIVEAGVKEVWIDEEKGLPRTPPPEPQVHAADPLPQADEPMPEAAKPPTVDMAVEVQRARKICLLAKEQVTGMFQDARFGKTIDPRSAQPLVGEIAASVQRNPTALVSIARLKTHDDYTYMHSVAVCTLMLALARELGLDEEQANLAGVGGLMHDLGKAVMPVEVLSKPGKLTDAEFAIMKQHPVAGAEMLRAGGADPKVRDIALHHHEKMNGSGYPDGLSGETISLLARMGAICDVYDAVTSERCYKKPWDPAHTMHQMATWEGHFDKRIFHAFVKAVGIYPVGSLVRLSSQRLAVVLKPGRESLLTPKVRVFYSLRSRQSIPMQVVDLAESGCDDSIIGAEDREQWEFKDLDDLWQP